MALKEIAQLLGFGAPIAAALAIYALFKFLDKKASGAAKEAISAWMKGEEYKQLDLGAAVIGGFDHLYGTPLLRITTFLRSACRPSWTTEEGSTMSKDTYYKSNGKSYCV
jgi:hypothetical protein